jgi:hypothetical protein
MISILISLEKVISNGPRLRKLMARKGNCKVGELCYGDRIELKHRIELK